MKKATRIAIGLCIGALAACSPQEPPASSAAPATAPPAQPTAQSEFIPTQAALEQYRAEGPDPTLRKIAKADYWLHYKLMQATGIEKELGGEAQAIEALKALGEAYERRIRIANEELPRLIPASFTGEGMSSGFAGTTMGIALGMITGGMAAGGVSGMSDKELKDLSSHGSIKQRSDGGASEIAFGEDGSVSQSLDFAINHNGVNGKVKVKTRMDACPDAEGRVTVEIDVDSQMSASGKPGTGGHVKSQFKYERFLDDDANLINSTGGNAANMRISMGGYENFEAQSVDITAGWERSGNSILEINEETGFSIFRPDEVDRALKLMRETVQMQTLMAEALLSGGGSGKPSWESGRCINLQVTSSPAKRTGLRPSAHFDLEAKPRAKDDGSPAGGTVTATLTGDSSLQPSSGKVKADAKYAYVGPEEKEKTASIAFESRSKRGVGRATLEFDTKTARAYRINGTTDGASFSGEACSLDQPFVVNVDAITGKWPMEFTPRDGLSGQMKGTYSGDDCTLSGGGPYSVKLNDDSSGTLTFTYTSTARCQVGVRTTTVTTELNLVSADDLKCD
jgi:hypothetical protein